MQVLFVALYELMYVCIYVFCWTTSVLFDVFLCVLLDCLCFLCLFCWTTSVLFDVFMYFAGLFVCFFFFMYFVGLLIWSLAMAVFIFFFHCTFFFICVLSLNISLRTLFFLVNLVSSVQNNGHHILL